ncbi:hypothetical protein GCM10022210_27850 [Mucilaginibacter dorajii]|uniref:Uncharacterized protein n=1 Tax=Mucilaginibacter dorajii TaxID=692994 RepID=A0ABP7Q3J4_9SPHI
MDWDILSCLILLNRFFYSYILPIRFHKVGLTCNKKYDELNGAPIIFLKPGIFIKRGLALEVALGRAAFTILNNAVTGNCLIKL